MSMLLFSAHKQEWMYEGEQNADCIKSDEAVWLDDGQ
jgi:hypothetical protein